MRWRSSESWLMVRDYGAKGKTAFDLTKRVIGTGKKAEKLAESYERELNGGKTWEDKREARDLEGLAVHKSVTATPFSQAREYTMFKDFQDAPFYQPK